MGKPILGTSSAVSLMKNSDLKEFYAKAYGSRRVVVAAAGNVSAERVVDEMGVLLDGLGGGDLPDAVLPVPSTEPRAGTRAKQVEQVHMCLGAVGLRADDPRQYSLHVLNNILGGGPSSRLFQIIREERGLAYSVYSFHSSFKDTGVFGVYSAANPEYAASVKQLVMDEMSDIAAKHVSDEELERAKRQLKGSLLLGLESMSSRMMRLGRSELLVGRVVPVDEVTRKIEAVTHDDVLSLAKELLHPAGLSLALVGADPVHTRRIARGG